jgi:hypothetical protein
VHVLSLGAERYSRKTRSQASQVPAPAPATQNVKRKVVDVLLASAVVQANGPREGLGRMAEGGSLGKDGWFSCRDSLVCHYEGVGI